MSGIVGAVVVVALVGLGQNPPACPLGEGWVFAPEFSDEFNDPSLDAK